MAEFPFDLNIKDIEKLAGIVKDNELGEIRIIDDEIGAKLIIKGRRPVLPPPPAPPAPALSPVIIGAQGTVPAQEKPAGTPLTKPKGREIKAPIVGTYYSSPAPDKPPFVKVGQKVKKGDVIMIIESMKLMNEIQCDFDGEVKEILVNNGQAVEFDQPIMIIG